MAVGIDMFGTGGEGLGGLFVGNQMAMQRDAAELERQKAMQDMANSQSIMRARDIQTSFDEQTLGDRVGAEREKYAGIKAKNDADKLSRTGEQFGQFSAVLEGVPPLARPAVLKSMAQQAGIAEDNPMYQSLSQIDPAELPGVLTKISQGFYEQSTAGRAEKLKKEEARITQREKDAAALERAQEAAQARRDIAQMAADARRDAANIAAATSRQNAQTRAGARSGPGGGALTTDKAIANLIMEDPTLSPQEKLEALQRYKLTIATGVGKDDAKAEILGQPKASQRVEEAIRGPGAQAKSTPKGTTKFKEGAVYEDGAGNKARYVNGKWVEIGAPAVPK